jgi:hypothetical protein
MSITIQTAHGDFRTGGWTFVVSSSYHRAGYATLSRFMGRMGGNFVQKSAQIRSKSGANRRSYCPQVQCIQQGRREIAHPPPLFCIRRSPWTEGSAAAVAPHFSLEA